MCLKQRYCAPLRVPISHKASCKAVTGWQIHGSRRRHTRSPPYLWMRFVSGSINFFPKRGSRGVRAPNCATETAGIKGKALQADAREAATLEQLYSRKQWFCFCRLPTTLTACQRTDGVRGRGDGGDTLCWATHQLDDLDEDPIVSGGGHELEEERRQGQVVFGVPSGQFADDVHSC